MGRKGVETKGNSVNVAAFLASAAAERELCARAEANALVRTSSPFTRQLWLASGLSPKLFGERRRAFLQQQEDDRMRKHEIRIPHMPKETRAMHGEACGRHTAMCPERPICPKLWKAEIIAEYEKSLESTGWSEECQGYGGAVPSSRTGSNGREMHQAAAVNVKLLVVCGSDRTSQAESAKKDSLAGRSVARKGSSSQTGVVITSPRANAKTNPAPSSSCCIHCQESLDGCGCGKPLLNCRDCGQVMHFDCYVEWSGSEPGPWDIVLCPAHTAPKRLRTKPATAAAVTRDKPCRSGNTTPRKRKSSDGPQDQDADEQLTPCKPGSGTLPSSPAFSRVSQKRRTSTDVKIHMNPGSSNDEAPLEYKGETLDSRRPESPSSPAPSYSSTDTTHHSPIAQGQEFTGQKSGHGTTGFYAGAPTKPLHLDEKLKDEELAMELHRQLNAPVSRRRRGE